MRAIREGKAPKGFGLKDSGVQSSNIYFTPEGKKRFKNPYLHLEEGKDYTVSAPYDVPYEAEPNSQGGTSGMLSKGYGKEIQENLNKAKQNPVIKEQISKYGNQQPEKNDEQRIAEKARGQYIREEQKKQRQDELNKKKQELLEKARKEREQRGNHQRITDPDQIGGTILPTKLNNANFTLTDPDHIYLARGKSIDRHGIEAPDMRKKNLSKYE